MKGTGKGAGRVTAVAQIGDVRLQQATARRRIRHVSEVGDKAVVAVSHGARIVGEQSQDGTFVVVAGVETRVSPSDDPKAVPYVQVKVSFEVSYRLPDGFSATRQELEEFARVNAVFNVWPYFREFIQSTTARMGLPPIVLPLYRVPKTTQTEAAKAQPTGASPTVTR